MKLDKEVQSFLETYDRTAMMYIDKLSSDYRPENKISGMCGFNITESIDIFGQYLEGYCDYKIQNQNNPNASSRPVIQKSVVTFIAENLFKPDFIPYNSMNQVIRSYLEKMDGLVKTVDKVKSNMNEAGVDYVSIGDVNDFADMFIESFHERFDPIMEDVLMASGYRTYMNLINPKTRVHQDTSATFL